MRDGVPLENNRPRVAGHAKIKRKKPSGEEKTREGKGMEMDYRVRGNGISQSVRSRRKRKA